MSVAVHEIRDAVHVFDHVDTRERALIDSWPLQRLRHIHQLALSDRIYPGATHSRFEHSLGVMELSGRVFDAITRSDRVTDAIRRSLPELTDPDQLSYWRRVLRIAALCHDIGHPPFSHAAEKALYPTEWNHERMTRLLLEAEPLLGMLGTGAPPLRSEDVIKLAVGPGKAKDLTFSPWESVLSEVIVGDAFGVDRMDYLLRDSLHAGVVYGRFDHDRLIDTLRILPAVGGTEPQLGIEHGGIHSAEALLLARYFMYSQVYFHPVRMVLDLHLIDYLRAILPGGSFPIDVADHLGWTDDRVFAEMHIAGRVATSPEHDLARRILDRRHFRILHQIGPDDLERSSDPAGAIFAAVAAAFGADNLRRDRRYDEGGSIDFPVHQRDDSVVSSTVLSGALRDLPPILAEYIFVAPELAEPARVWLAAHRTDILS